MYEQNSTVYCTAGHGSVELEACGCSPGEREEFKVEIIRALRRWWPHLFDIRRGGEAVPFLFFLLRTYYIRVCKCERKEGGKGGVGSEEDVGKLTKCEHDSSLILFAAQGHFDRIHFGRSNENPFDILFTKRICRQRKLAQNTIIKPPQQAQGTAGEARRGAVGGRGR